MPHQRPPSEQDEKRLRAELTAMRNNSEWVKARRRERIRLLLLAAAVGAAVVYVPWRQLTESALEALHMELVTPDAGSP